MKFDKIMSLVGHVPYISPGNAQYLYDLIIREKPKAILELGIAHGTATCIMAAALDELGDGAITSVDLLEAQSGFSPSPAEQLDKTQLSQRVRLVFTQTGYTWFLHDEIKRLTQEDVCLPAYDLCIIDGPKNWTIDGCAFFLVDKLLKPGGRIIFDDYNWTYAEADTRREATDGVTHRRLSEAERVTPHIKEVFELLVKQHPSYAEFSVHPQRDWAIARKCSSQQKIYNVIYGDGSKTLVQRVRNKAIKLLRSTFSWGI